MNVQIYRISNQLFKKLYGEAFEARNIYDYFKHRISWNLGFTAGLFYGKQFQTKSVKE